MIANCGQDKLGNSIYNPKTDTKVCLSVSYVHAAWLNRLMFSKNNITTAQRPGSLHCTAHRSNSRRISQIWSERRGPRASEGYVQKWHLRYNSCTAYRLVTNLVTQRELWPTFSGAKFFCNIPRTLFVGAQRNLAALGSGQLKLIPRISWTLVPGSRDTMRRHASVLHLYTIVFRQLPHLCL